ncbi:MAG: hypothetical protein K2L89_08650 [Muribaculaceae bacterium]|nr:hypothetical protein [Muribaculaceae bacterium]
MKNLFKISMAMPVALLLAGCSSDDVKTPQAIEGSYDVMMTVTTGETRAVTSLAGTAAENAYNVNRLFFGTYDENGALKHSLYEAGKCNTDPDLNVKYYLPTWGPTIAARLSYADYKDKTFYIGAFSIPEKMSFASLNLRGLDNADTNTLKWPGTSANNYVWTPTDDKNKDDHIPMAGVMKIEPSLMANYNSDINQVSPFRLPDITMTRAMAKIIIEDVDGIIETASLEIPEKGRLVPYLPAVLDGSVAMQPAEPTGGTGRLLNQKLTAPSETVNGVKRYVFYSFERSFLEYAADGSVSGIKKSTSDVRKIITLTANAASGLKGTTRETTHVSFAPHSAGIAADASNLRTLDGGAWQGVMRNTVYTFRVTRPSTGGVTIEVVASPWVNHEREHFDF